MCQITWQPDDCMTRRRNKRPVCYSTQFPEIVSNLAAMRQKIPDRGGTSSSKSPSWTLLPHLWQCRRYRNSRGPFASRGANHHLINLFRGRTHELRRRGHYRLINVRRSGRVLTQTFFFNPKPAKRKKNASVPFNTLFHYRFKICFSNLKVAVHFSSRMMGNIMRVSLQRHFERLAPRHLLWLGAVTAEFFPSVGCFFQI